jgi:hypothetical protein
LPAPSPLPKTLVSLGYIPIQYVFQGKGIKWKNLLFVKKRGFPSGKHFEDTLQQISERKKALN